jgi:hypothetical protein
MKKLLLMLVLGLLLSACSEDKSETNRKKSTIKLSCKINKIYMIKGYDGSDKNIWYDEKFIEKNLSEIAKPLILETNKNSYAIWIDGIGTLAFYHNENGIGYLNERDTNNEKFVTLHLTSISYKNFEFISESSVYIKKDDDRYNYNFSNKPEPTAIAYGKCQKLKWN